MAADLILVVAGLASAWAMFSIIGGETQRVVQNAELTKRSAPPPSPPEAPAPAKKPAAASAAKNTAG